VWNEKPVEERLRRDWKPIPSPEWRWKSPLCGAGRDFIFVYVLG